MTMLDEQNFAEVIKDQISTRSQDPLNNNPETSELNASSSKQITSFVNENLLGENSATAFIDEAVKVLGIDQTTKLVNLDEILKAVSFPKAPHPVNTQCEWLLPLDKQESNTITAQAKLEWNEKKRRYFEKSYTRYTSETIDTLMARFMKKNLDLMKREIAQTQEKIENVTVVYNHKVDPKVLKGATVGTDKVTTGPVSSTLSASQVVTSSRQALSQSAVPTNIEKTDLIAVKTTAPSFLNQITIQFTSTIGQLTSWKMSDLTKTQETSRNLNSEIGPKFKEMQQERMDRILALSQKYQAFPDQAAAEPVQKSQLQKLNDEEIARVIAPFVQQLEAKYEQKFRKMQDEIRHPRQQMASGSEVYPEPMSEDEIQVRSKRFEEKQGYRRSKEQESPSAKTTKDNGSPIFPVHKSLGSPSL